MLDEIQPRENVWNFLVAELSFHESWKEIESEQNVDIGKDLL